jgi:hypothetical protein
LPDTLAEKVLNDTLATWAAQAERAGAMKYELPVLSSGVLSKGSLETEDYLVSADLLRAKAIRIIKTIDELEKIPGALTIRASKDSVTLPEIRADIEDALRFELEPLLGIIRSEGITKNARLLSMYATTQVFQIRIEKAAAEGRARAVQNSLADYMAQRGMRVGADKPGGGKPGLDTAAVIPQFSESFLDRLVEMSATTQKSEMEYRQKLTDQIIKEGITVTTLDKELAYYEDVAKAVQGIGNRPAGSKELVDLIKSRSQKAFDAIAKAADHLVALYQELSTRNLNPAARLYVVTMPFSRQTVGALSWGSVAYSFVAVLLIVLIVVPAGCLIHNARVRRSAA